MFHIKITKAYEELGLRGDPAKAMLSVVVENPENFLYYKLCFKR